ncbi:MAG: two-component regulator propeller domain-containing protein, partial [Candidatus Parabeggiatoa sp.]|nr:two-component regulator propeller domain-containing protein [Candidatus Parabeggiatoa sp.]
MSIYIYRKMKLFWVIICLLASFQLRAEITFTPASPTVEVGQDITLSVSGTSGEITWTPSKGQIRGDANQATYIAPAQAGVDAVTLIDEAGNVGIVKIIVTPPMVSLENATWEVFTNRSNIYDLALSEDGKTLWIGTSGGLEKRDAHTKELERVFTSLDGLPSNYINTLQVDGDGGVWIGTLGNNDGIGVVSAKVGGLVHLTNDGNFTLYNTENSRLPNNNVWALFPDHTGLWIGTEVGLVYQLTDSDEPLLFNTENSGLPSNLIYAIQPDGIGGLWIGTSEGLAHFNVNEGNWLIFNTENSDLPNNDIWALESDGSAGLWIATESGLAHLLANNNWVVFNTENSDLPSDTIWTFHSDDNGQLWIGTSEGVAHLDVNGKGRIFNRENSDLPGNLVYALQQDNNGGIWTGSGNDRVNHGKNSLMIFGSETGAGLAHLDAKSYWTILSTEISGLTHNYINAINVDNKDGLWIGATQGGQLSYLNADGNFKGFGGTGSVMSLASDSGGTWIAIDGGKRLLYLKHEVNGFRSIVINMKEFGVLNNINVLHVADNNTLWIGGYGYLIFFRYEVTVDKNNSLSIQGRHNVFDSENSGLPNKQIMALQSDNQDLWIGTFEGLVHFSEDGSWNIFNTENSDLPDNVIEALQLDQDDGLWIGTRNGLAYLLNGHWSIFNSENSDLPDNRVTALFNSDTGKQWVGTSAGVAHLNHENKWTIFHVNNSSLPKNWINALFSDGNGGQWIGTAGGLAHLTFGQKIQVCTQINTETCDALLTGKRAAIIIAGGGAQRTNSIWDATEAISNRIYNVFSDRGFEKSEIYYLSPKPWADFNGDGFNDNITRTPEKRGLIVEDVRTAFKWAKTGGKLDQPLYVFFVDHGGPNKLLLAKDIEMQASEFKSILDDYQNLTGNKVILVIEACYSGSLVKTLAASNRAIISSAKDDELAYIVEKQGFTHFFVNNLWRGMNFLEAFNLALPKQKDLRGKLGQKNYGAANSTINTTQTPQLDDNADGIFTTDDGQWLEQVYVNGNFQTLDITLAVESLTTSTPLLVEQAIMLKAKATTAVGQVERVWAVVRPPKINLVLDSNGTPILAYPSFNLHKTEVENVWQSSWNDAVYNGDYEISFYAKDNEGNIEISEEAVVITVSGGVEPPPSASVDIVIEKERYARGESFQFQLV